MFCGEDAMYLKRLFLKDIRCFKELEIDFAQPGASILLLGGNGDGKSTILKSLAMGLCDESSAAALFRELPGEFVRREKTEEEVPTGNYGYIEIDLSSEDGSTYRINTRIISLDKFERVKQKLCKINNDGSEECLKQDTFPWDKLFVSGYGPGVRTLDTSDFQHYLTVDAVYPLFNYSSALQNPELFLHRLMKAVRELPGTPDALLKLEAKVLRKGC